MYIRTRVYIPEVVRFRFEREEKKKEYRHYAESRRVERRTCAGRWQRGNRPRPQAFEQQ